MKEIGRIAAPGLTAAAVVVLAASLPLPSAAQMNDKWVTIVMAAEPPDLEGCESSRSFQGSIARQNIVETLVDADATDGTLRPHLATAWEQRGPSDWRFKLRQGVTFHDGTPFNADTAKRSIDRTMSKAIVCSDQAHSFTDVSIQVAVVDDYTLDFKTSKPEPILPMRLAHVAIVGPNTPLDKTSLHPIGTGPYALLRWDAGQQILLKRFEPYWGEKNKIEGARYIWRDQSSVRAAMVEIGEADLAPNIAAQEATNPKWDRTYLNAETIYLRIDPTRAPLDDKRVRLALNYAFDREGMRGTLLPKDILHSTQVVTPSTPGHNHELDKRLMPYDPGKARQLLAEAKADGVPVDKEIILYGNPAYYPNAREVMEAFLSLYKAVGLNVKLINMDPAGFRKMLNKPFDENRGPALAQVTHDNNKGDPVFSVIYKYGCDGASSIMCDTALDKEVERVSGLSGQERLEGWKEIFRVLYDDIVPQVWMYHMVGFARVNPRISFTPNAETNVKIPLKDIVLN